MTMIYGTNGADALRGTTTADAIYGFWGDDSLFGDRGRDFLYGDQGNDTLDGGAGPDFLDGGDGFDLANYSDSTTPLRMDLRTGVVTFPGQSWPDETLVSIEAIDGGSDRDGFVGNGAANLFMGEGGSDTLVGNVGADTLIGGMGADSLDGGNGGDSLVGGLGDDTMLGGVGDDIFAFAEIGMLEDRVADDYEGQIITLVDYGRDVIDGGSGVDTLYVTGAAQSIDVWGSGIPAFVAGAPSVRANLGLGTLRMGDSDNRSTLISIENIETGSGHDSINGSAADNFIRAGDGANVVYALAGDDTIIGGYDIFDGDGGSAGKQVEILNGGPGDDVIYGMGSELVEYYDSQQEPGEEVLAGGGGDDSLYGGGAMGTLTGGAGSDLFSISDRYFYSYASIGHYFGTTTITDYEHGNDSLRFETVETDGVKSFAGAVDSEALEVGEVGYHREGRDTIVEANLVLDGEEQLLTIVLTGYTGPLSASDFDL